MWPDMPKFPKIESLLFLCNILREKWMTKLTFCMHPSMRTYYKLILWFWWIWSSISKVYIYNSKFTIIKKEDSDDVDFLHADNYQSGLQVDFNTLGTKVGYKVILWLLIGMMKHSQIIQCNNFANLCSISKKLGMEFVFCMQINIKLGNNKLGSYKKGILLFNNCFSVLLWCKTFRYFTGVQSCLLLLFLIY